VRQAANSVPRSKVTALRAAEGKVPSAASIRPMTGNDRRSGLESKIR
jgi:hypothetical protein